MKCNACGHPSIERNMTERVLGCCVSRFHIASRGLNEQNSIADSQFLPCTDTKVITWNAL